jgi:hypothetical protein
MTVRKLIYCSFIQYFLAMYVRVAQLFENGKPLPRHRSITAQPVHIGRLRLFEQHDTEYRRSMVYAVLAEGSTGAHILPRLHDAVVRWIGDGAMTISGFEHDQVTQECRAQSWYVQLVVDEASGQ